MEYFEDSTNNLSNFEFKYIPKLQFDRIVREVESKRRSRSKGMWGDFCTITSGADDADFIRNSYVFKSSSDERDVTPTNIVYDRFKSSHTKMLSTAAPLFGPARKYENSRGNRDSQSKPSTSQSSSSSKNMRMSILDDSNSSIHIVEEINVGSNHQVLNTVDDDDDNLNNIEVAQQITTNEHVYDVKSGSIEFSSDNDETIYSEILDMCNEIENSNERHRSQATSPSSAHGNEMMRVYSRKSKSDKYESNNRADEDLICETFGSDIDEKLDFLDAEAEEILDEQYPASKLRTEYFNRKDDESCNKSPMITNQVSKNEQEKPHGDEKSSVKMKSNRNETNLTRKNIDANERPKDIQEIATCRTKSSESSKSLRSLSVLLRVSGYQEKIYEYLGHLFNIIDNPPELDDVADLNKRQRRATEFTNRFARNHLYQIGRSAEELRLMPDNPTTVIISKVNSLFQIMMQAVQTYLKNVEMFIYNKNPDKLLVLVDFIISASKICFDRRIFDKRDVLVMRMLKKCAAIRDYLIRNENSKALFYETARERRMKQNCKSKENSKHKAQKKTVRKTTLPKRLSKTIMMIDDENDAVSRKQIGIMKGSRPNSGGSRVSFEDETELLYKDQDLYKIGYKFDGFSKKYTSNPYDSPKSPYSTPPVRPQQNPWTRNRSNLQSSRGTVVSHKNLKKSSSEISTMIQKDAQKVSYDNDNAEKPLEDETNETYVTEIMKMIQNITREKFEEMMAPMLAQLVPNIKPENECVNTSRVTADIEPTKKPIDVMKNSGSFEKIEKIAHNIQYMFVKSLSDDQDEIDETPKAVYMHTRPSSMSKSAEAVDIKITEKPPISACNIDSGNKDDVDHKGISIEAMREQALKERLMFIEKISKNPLYVNDKVKEPWKVFSRISDELLDEMLEGVIKELGINEDEIIKSFLNGELAY